MQKLFWKNSIAALISGTRRSVKQYAWEKLRPHNVTPQQCGVLLALYSEGGMSLGEVASRIWCDNPTACRIVNKLTERGLVRSDSDAQDRRRFRLFLTDEGHALCIELEKFAAVLADVVELGLSEQDLSDLRRILRQVMRNAVNATQRPDKSIAAATAQMGEDVDETHAPGSGTPSPSAPAASSPDAEATHMNSTSSATLQPALSNASSSPSKRVI